MSKYKKQIDQALNVFADGSQENCYHMLQKTIDDIKKVPESEHSCEIFYEWGLCLYITEEYQQALLCFEKSLRYDPSYEPTLLQIISVLFYHLDKPTVAQHILDKKILPQVKNLVPFKEIIEDLKASFKQIEKEDQYLNNKNLKINLPEDLSDLNLDIE